ncbi:MAG: ATP-binding protein [Gammaproteobacteria bacterium]|nr:MAG: ATP-binding protein [Gammaproteobacteria bacterium]
MKIESMKFVQGSLFEEDYLIRTLGDLSCKADVALTELVANAWDAGASKVDITIPEERNQKLIIKDDGIGLTKEEFHARWMKLGYDRLRHQGSQVEFPHGRTGTRIAYGRNGIGRHGLLCFDNLYTVITRKDGKEFTFHISTRSESQPFVLQSEASRAVPGNGTRLEVLVQRNLPNPDRILEVISARFLHDPQFIVNINGRSVPLEEHEGLIDQSVLHVNDNITLDILFIDTQKAARSTLYQGVAFWQGGRLVGEPSWTLGDEQILDGRTRFAKRYTFVAKTNDLAEYVNEDWTNFHRNDVMNEVYSVISQYIKGAFSKLAKEQIDETKVAIRKEFKEQYSELSALGKFEVDEVIEHVVDAHPTSNQETLGIAVEAVINLEKTRSGKALLQKLSQFSDDDILGLNRLLDQWTIKDALSVLDEIDRRMCVIEAIDKLSGDSQIDELRMLHPLVTEARWLFGPEFDSAEYTSNRQLRTIIKKIFKIDSDEYTFENERKRPDIFMLSEATASVTGAAQFNPDTDLVEIRRILIIELKRGGSSLSRSNRDQAIHYVEDFIGCKELTGNPHIFAFVVGETVSGKVVGKHRVGENGYVNVTTYAQLVDTARRRLFNLRETLTERYAGVTGVELAVKLKQMELGDLLSEKNEKNG